MGNKELEEKDQEILELQKQNGNLAIENQKIKQELKNCLMGLAIEKQMNGKLLQKWSNEID